MSATHKVIRYDLRAHGQSNTATEPFSNLDDLQSLLNELNVTKATFVGLSAGSTIALDLALQAPRRVPGARLIVVPGGGHLLNLTSPKEFQSAVSSFLGN